ncbi:MAG: ABC transporter ATP-binding protein [Planctomycetes bacterium]|nr:ABC transporter ATP-binding protein [Planctomycetota bacterium]
MAEQTTGEVLLDVNNLKTSFFTEEGEVKAVGGVSYCVLRGKTLGLVGESGCGKSVTAMSIMRLIPMPPGKIVDGSIKFEGKDLVKLPEGEMRKIRGNRIGMIFQEPMTSLNPVFTVGDQIMESIQLHQKLGRRNAKEKAIEMLKLVGIPDPVSRIDDYPHQMSGGMKQRVMIAMALSCNPALLIADEPTTALDVTIQAQILDLMRGLQKDIGMSILLITHDLAVVAEMCHHVAVMYAGRVVEYADAETLYRSPTHPYTLGLFRSIPKLGVKVDKLYAIKGMVPKPTEFPSGCKFNTRCDYAHDRCRVEEPEEKDIGEGHLVACHMTEDESYMDEIRGLVKAER